MYFLSKCIERDAPGICTDYLLLIQKARFNEKNLYIAQEMRYSAHAVQAVSKSITWVNSHTCPKV